MSSTLQFPVTDAFLLKYGAEMPENNKLELDPNYGNIELLTPYCRLAFVYFDPPKVGKPFKGADGTTVPGKIQYEALLMFNPAGIHQIAESLARVADNNFSSEERIGPTGEKVIWKASDLLYAPPNMQGALKNPLKNGTETWQNSAKPQMYEVQKGLWTLATKLPAIDGNGNPQAPVFLDAQDNPCSAAKFHAGCYARAVVRLTPYPRRGQQGFGNKGISAYLQVVQFVADGQRLGGFDAVAHGRSMVMGAGPVVIDPAFTAPIGAGVAGFAAPPAGAPTHVQQPQPQYAQQQVQQPVIQQAAQPNGPIPPHLPQGYVQAGGARPPQR